MSFPQTGIGTTLVLTTVGGTTSIAGAMTLMSIDGPNITVGEVETTVLSSTFKPYRATIPEGECTFNVRHLSTDPFCTAIRTAVKNFPVPSYAATITYEDGGTDAFTCFPKSYSVSGIENESVVNAAIAVRLTTAITSTPGTALLF